MNLELLIQNLFVFPNKSESINSEFHNNSYGLFDLNSVSVLFLPDQVIWNFKTIIMDSLVWK